MDWKLGLRSRPLSWLRVALSLLWMLTLVQRWPWISSHYTETGLLPHFLATTISDNTDVLSLGGLLGSALAVQVLFVFSFLVALGQLLGCYTRVMSVLMFLSMVLIDGRNQFLLNAGYETLRALQFWAMFLPLDHFYALRSQKKKENLLVNSWASWGLILQIVAFYLFGALFKDSPLWKDNGQALEMAVGSHLMAYPWANSLANFGSWLRPMGVGVWYFELLIPLLLLGSWGWVRARRWVLGLIIAFHAAIFLSLKIGFLPLANIAALMALWPQSASRVTGESRRRNAVGMLLIAYLALVNWNSYSRIEKVPKSFWLPSRYFLLDQSWMFFAPHPYPFDGWWELEAVDKSGQKSFLRANGETLKTSPQDYFWYRVGMEEKTFFIHLLKKHFVEYRSFALAWWCEKAGATQAPLSLSLRFRATPLPRSEIPEEPQVWELGARTCVAAQAPR